MALKRWLELVCDICTTKKRVELTGQERQADGGESQVKQEMIGWYNTVTDTEQGPETYLVCSGKCLKEVGDMAMKATIERKG